MKDCVANFHVKKLSHFFIYLLFLFDGLKGDGALLRPNGNNLSSDKCSGPGPRCNWMCVCACLTDRKSMTVLLNHSSNSTKYTHTHTTGWRVCSHCPVVMGLLSTAETLSHTFSWEIDFPEVPIPFVCALCVSESECVYVWESPTIKIILTIIVS